MSRRFRIKALGAITQAKVKSMLKGAPQRAGFECLGRGSGWVRVSLKVALQIGRLLCGVTIESPLCGGKLHGRIQGPVFEAGLMRQFQCRLGFAAGFDPGRGVGVAVATARAEQDEGQEAKQRLSHGDLWIAGQQDQRFPGPMKQGCLAHPQLQVLGVGLEPEQLILQGALLLLESGQLLLRLTEFLLSLKFFDAEVVMPSQRACTHKQNCGRHPDQL
jgi:hypothetical protein